MVGPIARTLADEVLVTAFDGLKRRGAIAPVGEINEGGRAPEQGGASDLFRSGSSKRGAVGLDPHMMEMYVRVDATRHDDAPARIDDPPGRVFRQHTWGGHCRNGLPGNRDVVLNDAVGRDDVTATNDCIEHSASRIRFASSQPAPQWHDVEP